MPVELPLNYQEMPDHHQIVTVSLFSFEADDVFFHNPAGSEANPGREIVIDRVQVFLQAVGSGTMTLGKIANGSALSGGTDVCTVATPSGTDIAVEGTIISDGGANILAPGDNFGVKTDYGGSPSGITVQMFIRSARR